MISRMTFCSAQVATTIAVRLGPMPSSSCKRAGVCSMTSNTAAPKACTNFRAKWGPMPLTMPDPKYRSMPSSVVGGTTRSCVVLNWRPCVRSVTHQPSPSMYSPGVMVGAVPTMVTRSRWLRTFTRRTQKPVSSLWKVTRSTLPARCSVSVSDGGVGVRNDMMESLKRGVLSAWRRHAPTHLKSVDHHGGGCELAGEAWTVCYPRESYTARHRCLSLPFSVLETPPVMARFALPTTSKPNTSLPRACRAMKVGDTGQRFQPKEHQVPVLG